MSKSTTPKNTTESIAAFKAAIDSGLHIHATIYEWWDSINGNTYFSYKCQCGNETIYSDNNIQGGYGSAGEWAIRSKIASLYDMSAEDMSYYGECHDLYIRLHVEKHKGLKRTMLSYGAK